MDSNKPTFKLNYANEDGMGHTLQVPYLLEKAMCQIASKLESYDPTEPDLVVNSMPWAGNLRGKKTVYWELDIAEFAIARPQEYYTFDIVYFPSMMNQALSCENGKWLPMAIDTDFFHPVDVPIEYDVVFLGRLDRTLRGEYIERLKQTDLKVLITQAPRGEESCEILSSGKCSFQVSEFKNLEQRNFEFTGVVPMVLERVKDLDKIMNEDEHFKGYDRENYEEFENQIRWCVKNYDQALAMRDRAIKHLSKNHSYLNRAKQILKDTNLQRF